MRVHLVRAGLTGFEVNLAMTIDGADYRADFGFPSARLALEYQGDYHRDPNQWRRDMSRDTAFRSIGWMSLYFNADDLRDPRLLVRRIARVLRERGTGGW
jgi:very-short-patch-repair endonuclease